MQKPGMPPDEQARLESLRALNILDTLSEERFDRVTRIARRLFDVPIALVSLIDANRQWFKSKIGLSVDETPRDISFCGHAILGDIILVIPDATQDERFAGNPLVMNDPKIRFYAGCPLSDHHGHNLGTLCVLDTKPRNFHHEDIQALKDLAAIVENELRNVQQVTRDELTQLSNRRGFDMLAQYSLVLCQREKLPASLVYIDLNDFKLINDRFSHAEGDRALMEFAQIAQEVFRGSDIFARLGGDEFALFLANTSEPDAEEAIAKFSQAMDKRNRENDRGYQISFAHGIVEYDSSKHDGIQDMLHDADSLMYAAKSSKSRK